MEYKGYLVSTDGYMNLQVRALALFLDLREQEGRGKRERGLMFLRVLCCVCFGDDSWRIRRSTRMELVLEV